MSNSALVSIIIPTKNRCELLRETLASVQAQTYPHWEAIVVDDGSTDGTEELVQSMAVVEKRIRFVRRERNPSGAPTCRNIGLALSKGECVLFLDSDDLLSPSCLELRIQALEANPDLMYVVGEAERFNYFPGDVRIIFGNGDERYDLVRSLCMHYPWQTAGSLWRRQIFDIVGNWDESLEIGQDVELITRILMHKLPYQRLHQRDYFYRQNPDGLGGGNEKLEKQTSHLRRIKRFCELLESRGLLYSRIRTIVAGNYLWIAQNFASAGKFSEAIATWKEAKNRQLVNKLYYTIGCFLLHAIRKGYIKVIAPTITLTLPRGFLINPECSNMSQRFVDNSGQYRPVHYIQNMRGYISNGEFNYWHWSSYPLRRLYRLLFGVKLGRISHKKNNA